MLVERRSMLREEAERVADGRVYTGQQALGVKLIDRLGGEERGVGVACG